MYKHLENKGLNSREIISLSNIDAKVKREQIELARYFNKPHAHHHCTKNWIYTNLLGVNMVQKSANQREIKSKDSKYRIFGLTVYMGV